MSTAASSVQSTLMLSISGLRGFIGHSLTPPVAARYAAAVGSWLKQSRGKSNPHIVLGRDSRPSGEMIEHAAIAGLTAVGCRVTTLGIVTTPSTAIMVDELRADAGMVITASHNPIVWNGIKTLRHDGVAPPPHEAQQIIERFKAEHLDYVAVEQLQPTSHNDTTNRVHVDRILKHVDVAAIHRAKLRVVLDSVHGAGGPATALLLRELGVDVVHRYAEPTGLFPHNPEPTAENLVTLSAAVKEAGAAVGFAQDPDADRLALVDETGVYIGEEYTLALCAAHVLSTTAGKSVANLSSSRMLDDVAAKVGQSVIRTPVGEANVANAMRESGAIIGGEGNGGIIWPKVVYVRDSLVGVALVLEMLAKTGNTLSQVVQQIPRYAIVKDKLPIQPGMADRTIAALKQAYSGGTARVDLQDGIRIDVGNSWVHVRPSNTEPIMRIIAEAPDDAAARQLIADVRSRI
jgi:phosphomannomutase